MLIVCIIIMILGFALNVVGLREQVKQKSVDPVLVAARRAFLREQVKQKSVDPVLVAARRAFLREQVKQKSVD